MELDKKPQVGQDIDEKIFFKNQRISIYFFMVMYDSCDCYST